MATIFPALTEHQLSELRSAAEAKVYRALRDSLPDDYLVLFQVGWVLKREHDQARDGEADFLICHPDRGFLCVEVKGGGIGFDSQTGQWHSIDRNGLKHEIKNPIDQSMRGKYSVLSKLSENGRWRELKLDQSLRGHCVFFPDLKDPGSVSRPDMPKELIGCAATLHHAKTWVDEAFAYWGQASSSWAPIGKRGVELIRETFARSFSVPPLIASTLDDLEAKRIALTKNQMRALDLLRSHRRAAVSGGAGTGKTLLAVEKAKRLASEGFRTLLTCYNRPLADHLASLCVGVENLDVMSFHQLCNKRVSQANKASGRDLLAEAKLTYPGRDLYDHQWPNALSYSTEVLDDRYDAIVCDEGQDFPEEFWVPIELLLADYAESPLYVFYDDNQNLYSRAGTFPIRSEPFTLTVNCRNTEQIHGAAYKHYRGVPVSPPPNSGEDIHFEDGSTIKSQAAAINRRIVDLVARQGVRPGDIAVLVADGRHKGTYYGALRGLPLPKPAIWVEEGSRTSNTVLLETVHRFKGLEAAVVFLWGLDALDLEQSSEVLYVGMTRAKSLLVVVADNRSCSALSPTH